MKVSNLLLHPALLKFSWKYKVIRKCPRRLNNVIIEKKTMKNPGNWT